MFDFELAKYIYWEYSLAVMFVSEMFKTLLKDIPGKFIQTIVVTQPKWLTLIVAIALGIGDWVFIDHGTPNYYQLIISFGLAVLGYDYGLKLLKDLIKKIKETFCNGQAGA